MSENVVANYGWATHEGPHSCNYISPKILELLSRHEVKRVLDIGSGNGAMCGELFKNGFDAVGMEFDEGGVKLSQASHPAVKFYRYGVQDNPKSLLATEEPFDCVISTEVIEHLYSPHLLPEYASGVLKPNGLLILSTPYHGYVKNLALSIMDHWDTHHTPLWHGGHIKFWSRKTLTTLLERNGFEVVGFEGVGRLPYLWKSMILIAQKLSNPTNTSIRKST